jgi:hypothetical protein
MRTIDELRAPSSSRMRLRPVAALDRAAGVEDLPAAVVDPAHGAVGPQRAVLDLEGLAAAHLLPGGLHARTVLWMHDLQP